MSPWCRHARHADCDDPACDCPCHLRHLETVAMVERCAKHQDVAAEYVAGRPDEFFPFGVQYHAPSDHGVEGVKRLDDDEGTP